MNITDLIKRIELLEDKVALLEKKRTGERFSPPSLSDITEFTQNEVLARNFFDYYEGNGWMVGKVKMKDWRATARRWMTKVSTQKQESNEQRIGRISQNDIQSFIDRH
jgi:hypothetical protein